jgi:hypothetical protein
MNRTLRFYHWRPLLRPFSVRHINDDSFRTGATAFGNGQGMRMTNGEVRRQRRQATCVVYGFQNVTGPNFSNVRRAPLKDVQKHPLMHTVQ